ncbi:MAG: hypothetical protein AAB505_03070, partial [Patescibacteria group bacterium]
KPHRIDQRIIFSGIIPGVYTGDAAKIFNFSAMSNEKIMPNNLKFGRLEMLLNDGLGTKAKITPGTLRFSVEGTPVIADVIPPEDFQPVISSDPTVLSGQPFVVFATQDKQSGVDHYEVAEGRWFFSSWFGLDWTTSDSPHQLADQTGRSRVYVKAIDRAGNERVTIVIRRAWYQSLAVWIIIILLACVSLWSLRKFFLERRLSQPPSS